MRMRRPATALAAAALAAFALTGCAPQATSADIVQEYLEALADGDAAKATELSGNEAPDGAELFDSAVEYISNPVSGADADESWTPPDEEPYESVVPVNFTLGGDDYEVELLVVSFEGDVTIEPLVGTIDGNGALKVGRTEIQSDAVVYPAVYPVESALEWFTFEHDTLVVGPGDSASVRGSINNDAQKRMSEQGRAEIVSAAQEALDQCTFSEGYVNVNSFMNGDFICAQMNDRYYRINGDRNITFSGVPAAPLAGPRFTLSASGAPIYEGEVTVPYDWAVTGDWDGPVNESGSGVVTLDFWMHGESGEVKSEVLNISAD